MTKRLRVRAPELQGRAWLNTGGAELSLGALRGKIVVLDFWTFCCVNCLHVLDELRELEHGHPETLVVLGVHSPKFAHEAEPGAVVDAVERYGVEHPVLDDPELATWNQYAVRAWPTLVVIDPEGYVVAQHAGEGHVHAIEALVRELEAEHGAKGTLHRGEGPYVPPEPAAGELRFPGKALVLPASVRAGGDRAPRGTVGEPDAEGAAAGWTLLVSDTTRHQLVELAADGETVLRRVGSGERGLSDSPGGPAAGHDSGNGPADGGADGPADGSAQVRFSEPQGLALLPGGLVLVADTVNHALRTFDPVSGEVRTVAGTGEQWMRGTPTDGPALQVALSSPWDVAWFGGRAWIAMAGVHQLWTYDPGAGTVRAAAGTANEGLADGPAAEAWFAQPSGLAVSPDGERLWVADSETSALRWIDRRGEVHTAVGSGLFDFGLRDGAAHQALLQHPLGVTALPGGSSAGSVAVCDTYNHALRRYDPATDEVTTLATDVREPSDAVVVDPGFARAPERGQPTEPGVEPGVEPGGDSRAEIVVVESARHRLTRLRLPEEALRVEGVAHHTQRAATEVAPGALQLDVVFQPPPGQKLDERQGPATRLLVSSSPPELLASGEGRDSGLRRELRLAEGADEGVLHISAMAASCDDAGDGPAPEYPACHVHQQDWGVPVRVTPGGTDRLPLVLAGMDETPER